MKDTALARRFGTPLYVYDGDLIRERLRALRGAFSRQPLICYAMKANSNKAVCSLLAKAGAGADIVSGGELARALAAGFSPKKIVFSGVGKTREELRAALRAGILTFNVESAEELSLLEKTAREARRRAPVSIRVNPDVDPKTHPHITTGRYDNKFGVDPREAVQSLRKASRSRHLAVRGVQCHIGSQITDAAPYKLAAKAVGKTIKTLLSAGVALELVDLGGGLGVSVEGRPALDVRSYASALEEALAPWPDLQLLIEPGRWLVADAGVLLTTVLYRKQNPRRRFVVVDAAMNDLARPALYGAKHPIAPVVSKRGPTRIVDVVGPVCESGDFLARQIPLGPCAPGDVLAVRQAGAYGFSMSSNYNSRPRAAEALVTDGKARLVRRRETIKDIIRNELA
jgi:diaminopimelate decarboxylase